MCACYLAPAGLEVVVLEAAATPGGCISTMELSGGRGRLEVGAHEHGGLRGSGVAADLELETRFGLRFHLRDQTTLAPCDDGAALAFDASLERTVDHLAPVVGAADADGYRRFAAWAGAGMALLDQVEDGPPPSLRELAALAEAALGPKASRFLQALLGSASNLVRAVVTDERLQAPLAHWAAHTQQSPADPGTGAGALALAGGHAPRPPDPPAAPRPPSTPSSAAWRAPGAACARGGRWSGSRSRAAGPWPSTPAASGSPPPGPSSPPWTPGGCCWSWSTPRPSRPGWPPRPGASTSGGATSPSSRWTPCSPPCRPCPGRPASSGPSCCRPTPPAKRAFAGIQLGRLPERPPLMLAFPSTLEEGWAPPGRAALWLSTFVPWRLADGPWDAAALERAADHAWRAAEKALGTTMEPVERHLTGPLEWVARTGNPMANPNHVEMSLDQLLWFRPSPSLSGYRTPIGGLFLTGAGTHPGGGVTGRPGRTTAAVVLDALGAPRGHRARRLRRRLALARDAARALRFLRSGDR